MKLTVAVVIKAIKVHLKKLRTGVRVPIVGKTDDSAAYLGGGCLMSMFYLAGALFGLWLIVTFSP